MLLAHALILEVLAEHSYAQITLTKPHAQYNIHLTLKHLKFAHGQNQHVQRQQI